MRSPLSIIVRKFLAVALLGIAIVFLCVYSSWLSHFGPEWVRMKTDAGNYVLNMPMSLAFVFSGIVSTALCVCIFFFEEM